MPDPDAGDSDSEACEAGYRSRAPEPNGDASASSSGSDENDRHGCQDSRRSYLGCVKWNLCKSVDKLHFFRGRRNDDFSAWLRKNRFSWGRRLQSLEDLNQDPATLLEKDCSKIKKWVNKTCNSKARRRNLYRSGLTLKMTDASLTVFHFFNHFQEYLRLFGKYRSDEDRITSLKHRAMPRHPEAPELHQCRHSRRPD